MDMMRYSTGSLRTIRTESPALPRFPNRTSSHNPALYVDPIRHRTSPLRYLIRKSKRVGKDIQKALSALSPNGPSGRYLAVSMSWMHPWELLIFKG